MPALTHEGVPTPEKEGDCGEGSGGMANYFINAQGLEEIARFLNENHKLGDTLTPAMLGAWAEDAEFQLSCGNPATIELKSRDSIHRRTQQFTVSALGIGREKC